MPVPGPGTPSSIVPTSASIFTADAVYTVGTDTESVFIDCWGAPGEGSDTYSGIPGFGAPGLGGYIGGWLAVSPGQVLNINFNSDGGPRAGPLDAQAAAGGESVDVRLESNDPSQIVLQAGGGGGGGGSGSGSVTPSGGSTDTFWSTTGGAGGPGGASYPPENVAGSGEAPTVITAATPGTGAQGTAPGTSGQNDSVPSAVVEAFSSSNNPITGVNTETETSSWSITPAPPIPSPVGIGGVGGTPGSFSSSVHTWTQAASADPYVDDGTAITGAIGGWGGSGGGGYQPGAGGGGGGAWDTPAASEPGGAGGGGGSGGTSYASVKMQGVRTLIGAQSGAPAVMITPNPPAAVVLTSPASGSIFDGSIGFVLDWLYQGKNPQAFVAIRRRLLGSPTWEWWSTSGWITTEFFGAVAPTLDTATMSGLFPNGSTYEIQMAAGDSTNAYGPYGDSIVLTFRASPTVTATAPTGTATSAFLTATWTSMPASDAVVVDHEVVVSSGGVVFFDSGLIYGDPGEMALPPLPNGSYILSVGINQTGGQGALSDLDFTVDAPTLAQPTIAVVGSPSVSPSSAVINLAGTPTGATAVVQRSYDNGNTWATLRSSATIPGSIIDDELCPGCPTLYRAYVYDSTSVSEWVSAGPILTNPTSWWLSDPLTPGSALKVYMQKGKSLSDTIPARQTVMPQIQTVLPVVESDLYGTDQLSLPFMFLDNASWVAFLALVNTNHVLLLASPTLAAQWYVLFGNLPADVDLGAARAGVELRNVTVAATVVGVPPASTMQPIPA